ncbi:TPA: hypothetical protein MFX25_01085 [Klebsiella pneumoniae]|nr:hypothetical protein [Klebsiella pneumoniae]HBW9740937.1 hypothetical protein [Klebsiella pneumoniae]
MDTIIYKLTKYNLIFLMISFTATAKEQTKLELKCRLNEGVTKLKGSEGYCNFNSQTQSFKGSSAEQARCLLRFISQGNGSLKESTITPFLEDIVGKKAPEPIGLIKYISIRDINENDLGGPLNIAIEANYFIIHDTSNPKCSNSSRFCPPNNSFPPDMNSKPWLFNKNFDNNSKNAHVYTNRVGASKTVRDFSQRMETTKFEICTHPKPKPGLFVGVENIQPRRDSTTSKKFKPGNGYEGPIPGFTDVQYERLALIYTAASVRRGKWLIPAFHGVIDHYYYNGHDDPQNFDMATFSKKVEEIRNEIIKIN